MKIKFIIAALASCLIAGCASHSEVTLVVSNESDNSRTGEVVEIPVARVCDRLGITDGESLVLLDEAGSQVPYQITHDGKFIFQVTAGKDSEVTFTVRKGVPEVFSTKVFGRLYPERMDDLAWENDKVAFRAYGPALQARGEKGFGYDLFAKRGTSAPVLDSIYAGETRMVVEFNYPELVKTDPEKAKAVREKFSYHVDRGFGMDCYAVGPTLGAGVAALVEDGEIVYPWCFRDYEILDNGPLRFTVRLAFTPLTVGDKANVIETRTITLDAGSHLNRTEISYANLDKETDIVTGIVLHDRSDRYVADKEGGYIAYQDPTTGPGQGELYLGHAFAGEPEDAKAVYFSEEERKVRNNAFGHVLACDEYTPGQVFTYWWGFGWNKSDIPSFEEWKAYMRDFAKNLRKPLKVAVK